MVTLLLLYIRLFIEKVTIADTQSIISRMQDLFELVDTNSSGLKYILYIYIYIYIYKPNNLHSK